ncbi:protein ACCELERATED CELL DEATH 6-like [Coffea arabica]|uniref:Protein ACCELERATED CELL DEATH 6-like n=1 Tax=Coffea arabica TaxID=13443 RepID=A0A6P6VA20_COFAR|nr:protein ACCELERATED CELL DEATH 6-like [Coffea arabica]XP_027099450.1 protein ACCELERATED CELL DEATH 6-like [Coffea arabica]XP_027099451.1 protein ACCELERATED CELL DEATH 6-like [Coffea arabica]
MHPELYAAAQSGDWGLLGKFSDELHDQRTPKRNTVLHVLAQSCDSADAVRHILARNCCLLMAKNARGETALHLAARNGNSSIVGELIDQSKQNKGCWSCACFVDRRKMMLRMANVDGNAALHEAVKNNFYEVANLLVQEDPEFRYRLNYASETPLYVAVEMGHRHIADLILKTCKSPSYLGPGHKTALHAAAIWDLPESMELILEKRPDLIQRADKFGWTALHYAAKFNHQEIARLLLSADRSTAYVAAKNDDSKTALHIAVIHGRVALVQEILSHCPDCWEECTYGRRNILHLAVKYEKREVLEFALEKYPWASELINQKDRKGNTPLHLYAATKTLEGKSLLNHPRVDVNSIDRLNSTPLDRILQADELSERQSLIRDELQQVGGTPGYRNVATLKKNLQSSKTHEPKKLQRLAGNYLIVATLIATVTFAAGFTVPGGYYSSGGLNQGLAVLGKKAAFITFVISDSLAIMFSIGAVVRQLKILQTKNDRYKWSELQDIQTNIFVAVISMMIAFITGLYSVLQVLPLKIVLCVLAAFFCIQTSVVFLSLRPNKMSRTYMSIFRNTTDAYCSFSIGALGIRYENFTDRISCATCAGKFSLRSAGQ